MINDRKTYIGKYILSKLGFPSVPVHRDISPVYNFDPCCPFRPSESPGK